MDPAPCGVKLTSVHVNQIKLRVKQGGRVMVWGPLVALGPI